MNERWSLPKKFLLDSPEKLTAASEAQRELAKKSNSPFARLSPQEAEFLRARRIEEQAIIAIESLNVSDRDEYERILNIWRTRLAEALAIQGKFAEAVDAEPDETKKKEYADYRDASSVGCKCINQGVWNGRPFRTTARYVKKRVFGQPDVIACGRCGGFSREPTPQEIAIQEQHQAAAQEAVGKMSPAEASAELAARSHTAALLTRG